MQLEKCLNDVCCPPAIKRYRMKCEKGSLNLAVREDKCELRAGKVVLEQQGDKQVIYVVGFQLVSTEAPCAS